MITMGWLVPSGSRESRYASASTSGWNSFVSAMIMSPLLIDIAFQIIESLVPRFETNSPVVDVYRGGEFPVGNEENTATVPELYRRSWIHGTFEIASRP